MITFTRLLLYASKSLMLWKCTISWRFKRIGAIAVRAEQPTVGTEPDEALGVLRDASSGYTLLPIHGRDSAHQRVLCPQTYGEHEKEDGSDPS